MRDILNLCKAYLIKMKWTIMAYVVLCFMVSLCSVVLPYLSGCFVDALCEANSAGFIWKFALLFCVIGFVELSAGYLSKRLYYMIQIKLSSELNADAIYRVQNVTSQYVQSKDTAFLNQQINNDSCDVIIFCISVLHDVLSNAVTLAISLFVLLFVQPLLGWIMVAINIAYYFIYIFLRKPMYKRSYDTSESQLRFFAKLDEQLSNVKFLQIHGISKKFVDRLDACIEDLLHKILKEHNISYCFTGSHLLLKMLANLCVFFIGGAAVIENRLSIGNYTILMSYFTMSMASTQYFFNLGKDIQENMVSCDRLDKIFQLKEQTQGQESLSRLSEISCNGVSFGYSDEKIFHSLNLHFRSGKLYALVGENGAGKSTLIQLLLGIYVDEYQGQILYNGIPIEKLNMSAIREQRIGVSEQEPELLPETLLYNLTLDDTKTIPAKEFEELCSMLDLTDLLSNLPNGLYTQINEGTSNLSGGEKQKLSILRALLKKPDMLILDEPTSALDRQSKSNLCDYLRQHKQDMIIILSTHDTELLQICDEVVEISDERGKACFENT